MKQSFRRLSATAITACAVALCLNSAWCATAKPAAPPTEGQLPLDDLRTFSRVLEQIKATYVEEVDDKTLLENSIRGMLNELDPHSAYLDEKDFSDLQNMTSGEFGGLGIEVSMEDGFVKVITPI